jgi:hypothetical protein
LQGSLYHKAMASMVVSMLAAEEEESEEPAVKRQHLKSVVL